jgi:hypothetical protein
MDDSKELPAAGGTSQRRAKRERETEQRAGRRDRPTHRESPRLLGKPEADPQEAERAVRRYGDTTQEREAWLPFKDREDAPAVRYVHKVLAATADSDGVARFVAPVVGEVVSEGWEKAAYAIVQVWWGESKELVDTVAPGLLEKLGLLVGSRSVKAGEEILSIGVEIILSQTEARSGAHYDADPSILVPIVGTREVWCAQHETFQDSERGNADSILKRDPHEGERKDAERAGWTPWKVKPGQSLYLPRHDWHSVKSPPGSIALSVTVHVGESGARDGGIPRGRAKYGAPTKTAVGGWSSPKAFALLWGRSGGSVTSTKRG